MTPEEERVDEDLARVDWYGRELGAVLFRGCRFYDADLTECVTTGTVFEECDFSGAKLNASVHERSAFLRCRFRKASLFDATLRGCKLTGSELGAALLRPLHVEGGDWSYVDLRRAELAGVDLSGVRLAEADLTDADLREAVLRDADLSHARLTGARLAGADLRGAVLDGVVLRELDLTGARIDLGQAAAVAAAHGAVVDPG